MKSPIASARWMMLILLGLHAPLCAQGADEGKKVISFIYLKCTSVSLSEQKIFFYRIPRENQNIRYEDYFSVWNADERQWDYPSRGIYIGIPSDLKYSASVTQNIAKFEARYDGYGGSYGSYWVHIVRRTGKFSSGYFTDRKEGPSLEGLCEIGQPNYHEINKF